MDRNEGANGEGVPEQHQERGQRADRGSRGLPHPGLAARPHRAVPVLDLLGSGSVRRGHQGLGPRKVAVLLSEKKTQTNTQTKKIFAAQFIELFLLRKDK